MPSHWGWWYLFKRDPHFADAAEEEEGVPGEDPADDLDLQNPFELFPALRFALLLILIIGGAHVLQQLYGGGAIFVAAILGGLAETNAISLTLARMESLGTLSATVATQALVIAILANSFVKAGLAAFIGSRRLGLYVAGSLVPIMLVGLWTVFFLL